MASTEHPLLPNLFCPKTEPPHGFRYGEDLLSSVEEKELVRRFETLPFKAFEFHGYFGNRRIVSYGYRYDYIRRALHRTGGMPDFLHSLRAVACRFSGQPEDDLVQALVTQYAPGAGIGWHRDKPMFEKVVALSFLGPCDLRLRRKSGNGWERRRVSIAPRSAYLLSGEVREEWEHSIIPVSQLRYSVTFRSLRAMNSVSDCTEPPE